MSTKFKCYYCANKHQMSDRIQQGQYHTLSTALFFRYADQEFYNGMSSNASISYQRGCIRDEDDLKYEAPGKKVGDTGRWYGEEIHNAKTDAESLTQLAKLFTKMEKYQSDLYNKNLKLDCYTGDHYEVRLALLKAIGVQEVRYDRTEGGYVVW